MSDEAKKSVEPKKKEEVKSMSKADIIKNSKMPEWQKEQMLKKIAPKLESNDGKIPFNVYAKMKKIDQGIHRAMLAYPKAKSVSLATLQEWDEIFKGF